ncbi:MAG: hypothetical protein AB1689_20140 [Thermodesulfobacteriota bacterium]
MSVSDANTHGALVACTIALALLLPCGAARADDRAEIEALKGQIAELVRRDQEKQRQLDEMMELLRRVAPQAALEKQKRASDTARAEPAAKPPPSDVERSRRALDAAVADLERRPTEPTAQLPAAPAAGATRPAPDAAPPLAESTPPASAPLDVAGATSVPGTLLSQPLPGQATLRLLEPSLDLMVAAGWSTANDAELETLQGGAHDPDRRGFTLQQAELGLFGAVDPYFTAESYIVFTPDEVELEEAYGTTQRLPWNLQLKAGYYLTEFGRINPTHPHAWPWIDQPIVNTRMFGGEGLRSAGARLSWLLPLPLFSELYAGVQNANEGDLTASFLSPEGVGGRPGVRTDTRNLGDLLYFVRSATAWNMGDEVSALLGFSGLFGPNSTGGPARTFLYGADLTVKWRPADNFRGWPFLLWQSEVMKRDYTAEPIPAGAGIDEDDEQGHAHGTRTALERPLGDDEHEEDEEEEDIPGALLRDWGFYTQLLYGFHYPWSAGVRFEWASGSGESVGGRANDPLRDDRFRFSPLLTYQPSEFARIRLQYNFDHATALPGEDASTVWLGLELLYGAHPAHQW